MVECGCRSPQILGQGTEDNLARLIAHNLPSPTAQAEVWDQTDGGPVFNLAGASAETRMEWRKLAMTVLREIEVAGQGS